MSTHNNSNIHSTAIIAEGAVIPASCKIGPFCTIGPDVVLGEDCELVSHVVLEGHSKFGRGNKIYSFACLGVPFARGEIQKRFIDSPVLTSNESGTLNLQATPLSLGRWRSH